MDTVQRELMGLVGEGEPPLLDFEQLERLVTEDELGVLDDECTIHDGCRPILHSRLG